MGGNEVFPCASGGNIRFPIANHMGGPCFLLVDTEAAEPVPHAKRDASFTPASSLPGRPRRRVPAPSCTDNFQVAPFSFDGALWQSVEQCFQAYKFNDVEARERIRAIVKQPGEHDHSHGMRVSRGAASSLSRTASSNSIARSS